MPPLPPRAPRYKRPPKLKHTYGVWDGDRYIAEFTTILRARKHLNDVLFDFRQGGWDVFREDDIGDFWLLEPRPPGPGEDDEEPFRLEVHDIFTYADPPSLTNKEIPHP